MTEKNILTILTVAIAMLTTAVVCYHSGLLIGEDMGCTNGVRESAVLWNNVDFSIHRNAQLLVDRCTNKLGSHDAKPR